ncbi:cytochrome c oxidase subunit 4 [Actinocorallia aurea]
MRVQAFMFYGCGIFFLITDIVYWIFSGDWTGTTAMALAVGLAFMIGVYIHFTVNRIERLRGGELPEDDKLGDIADSAGDQGFFSPHSWWPLWVGLACATLCLGMIFGTWLMLLGAALVILGAIGFVFEYYRGQYVA